MNKIWAAVLACVASLFLVACSDASSPSASGGKEVTIAVLNTNPPFNWIKDGELTGFEVDLINAVAQEKNWTVHWKPMKFDAMIPALQARQVDAAAGSFFMTDARRAAIDFSQPYYAEGNAVAVTEAGGINEPAQLTGKTIVAKQGAASAPAAQKLAEQHGAAVQLLQDEPAMLLALDNGTAQAMVNDSAMISYEINDGHKPLKLIAKLDSTDVGLAFPKGSPLRTEFDEAVAQLRSNGTFDTLKKTYLD